MKKQLIVLALTTLLAGCGGSKTDEQKLLENVNVEVKMEDAKDSTKGIYNYTTFSTNGCEYSFVKNKNQELVGIDFGSATKCKDEALKILNTSDLLSEKGKKELKSAIKNTNKQENALLIGGYTIKVTDKNLSAIKEGVPTSAKEVVRRMKELGIPITDEINYTAENDVNEKLGRPGEYTEKTNWNDDDSIKSKLKKDKERYKGMSSNITASVLKQMEKTYRKSLDNTIEKFDNTEDLNKRYEYIKSLSDSTSIVNQYLYKQDNYLMRVSYDVSPTNAKKYETIFNKLFEEN